MTQFEQMRVQQIKNAVIQCNFNVDELFAFGEFIAREIENRFKTREGIRGTHGWPESIGCSSRSSKKDQGAQREEGKCRLRLSGQLHKTGRTSKRLAPASGNSKAGKRGQFRVGL